MRSSGASADPARFRRIDIHAHTNFAAYDADRNAVIARALDAGTAMINVGTQADTSRSALALAERYPAGVYAIVGLHPIHTDKSFHDEAELGSDGSVAPAGFTSRGEAFDAALYRELASHPKAVGIGEVGLDYYHHDPAQAEKQKAAFVSAIQIANELGKPLMLHIRDAYDDALEILEQHLDRGGSAGQSSRAPGDVHFFAGTIEQAKRFLDLGFTISFTGAVTFPPAKARPGKPAVDYAELIRYVPLDMIQAETDCPFVAPVPHRGERNEPAYVAEVYARIAEIKQLPLETIEQSLVKNAERVWGIALQ